MSYQKCIEFKRIWQEIPKRMSGITHSKVEEPPHDLLCITDDCLTADSPIDPISK